jgi:PAS domain S-box-containing protein
LNERLVKPAKLNLLFLEDNEDVVLRMVHELECSGFTVCSLRTDTEAGFLAALEPPPDLILANYSLQTIDPFRALDLLQKCNLKITLIVVSNVIEDSIVDSCIWGGAADFIHKDRLGRLGIAVTQALECQSLQDNNRHINTRYRLLFEHARDICLFVRFRDGQILEANQAAVAAYGFSRQELLGLTIWDLRAPQTHSQIATQMVRANDNGILFKTIHRRKDGSEFPVEVSSIGTEIDGDRVNISTIRDISERARVEAALSESEERYRKLVELLPDALYVQIGGKFAFINPAGLSLFGAEDRGQILGHSILDHIHSDFREIVQRRIDCLNDNRLAVDRMEQKILRLDGTAVDVEVIATPFVHDNQPGALVLARDITERKRAEQALRESEERYRRLFEFSPDAIALLSDGRVTIANRAWAHMWGAEDPAEVVGFAVMERVHPAYRGIVADRMAQVDKGSELLPMESRHVRLDGSVVDIEVIAAPILQAGVRHQLVIARDITERKKSEAAVRESEQNFRSVVENSGDGIVLTDIQGLIVEWNQALTALTGLPREKVVGKPIWEIHDLLEVPAKRSSEAKVTRTLAIKQFFSGGTLPWLGEWQETDLHHLDGESRRAEVKIYSICTPLGAKLGAIWRDVTEQRRAEARVAQQAREFAVLYETTLASTHQRDLHEVVELLLEQVTSLMGVAYAFISLHEPARQHLRVIASKGAETLSDMLIPLGKGLAGRVARTGQPLVVDNYQASELALPEFAALGFAMMVGVPLVFSGELVGVLSVAETGTDGRKFSEAEVHLLSLFGSIAASAIHNARLFDKVQERVTQLSLLYDAGLALNNVLELHPLLEKLFEIARDMLSCDQVEFFHFDSSTNAFHYELGIGWSDEVERMLKEFVIPLDGSRSITRCVGENHQPVNLPDVLQDPRYQVLDPNIRSGLWVPVQHGESLIGVIAVFRTRKEPFTPQEENLLVLIANQAAIAMENARLYKESQRQFKHIKSLWAIDQAILSKMDLQEIFDVFLKHVVTEFGFDAMTLFLFSPESQTLKLSANRGLQSNEVKEISLHLGEGHVGRVALKREIEFIADLKGIEDALTAKLRQMGEHFVSYIALPLIAKGELKGVLELFSRTQLKLNEEWKSYLNGFANQGAIAIDNAQLLDRLLDANYRLLAAYDATIDGWSRALDLRDKETEGHSQRVTELTLILASEFGVSEKEIPHYRRGALLHDIGKMGVPDQILLKSMPLTRQEWEIMSRHPVYAYELLSGVDYLRPALDIPYCHHEKWDGSGYPRGLKGVEIPLSARIFAIVDVWDALTSDRPYRPAWSKKEALRYIKEQSGIYFDPQVVEAFLKLLKV